MKRWSYGLAALTGSTMLAVTAAHAEGDPVPSAPNNGYTVCVSCHGAHGEGREALDGPRIGDLSANYVAITLKGYRDGAIVIPEDNDSARAMVNIARGLTDDQIDQLAVTVESLSPKPLAATAPVDGGEDAYQACAACHGPDARGVAATGGPDLLYQAPDFLASQLKAYRDGHRGGAGSSPLAPAMAATVAGMDDDAIDLVVGHIGSLRPDLPPLDNPEVTLGDEEGLAAFEDIFAVSTHPRCLNCHPDSDTPYQGDDSTPHTMNITRTSPAQGVHCQQCHPSTAVGDGAWPLPPADPVWSMPSREMAFENRSPQQLCEQLKDPAVNGGRGLVELTEHVENDHLLMTSWHSGRTPPPISHEELVERFETWSAAGAPCPSE